MAMLKGLTLVIVVSIGFLLTGCGGGGTPIVGNLPTGGPAARRLEAPPYTLASGDKIKVTVFRHEDLSGEFQLDGAGNFAMPLIGEIQAYGVTTRELEQRIEKRLAEGYLVDPKVSIEVLSYRPFYILGEVNKPGQYEYANGMTVLNAVALAGGFTYRAKQDAVSIKRGGSNAPGVIVTGDTPVLPGDILEVPERFF